MGGNKGKPSGKYAEKKTDPGRKRQYQRSGWPEDAPTQRVEDATGQQVGIPRPIRDQNFPGTGRGRNKKAGPK
ncbi:MAG: hypothetical protein AB9869_00515 [Verrucomicrobiia bacterium]